MSGLHKLKEGVEWKLDSQINVFTRIGNSGIDGRQPVCGDPCVMKRHCAGLHSESFAVFSSLCARQHKGIAEALLTEHSAKAGGKFYSLERLAQLADDFLCRALGERILGVNEPLS
jgi:hypothetical protein